MSIDDRLTRGMANRREVLGDEYVDAARRRTGGFDKEFQDFVTEYAWGTVWDRPGLPRSVRSLLNIAMLSALNRPAELELHMRSAFRNGAERAEIEEVILQVGVYCGLPAAVEALKTLHLVSEDETATAAAE
ncbi:carboxymuconolactone decarboxylase family protein [Gordonia sp. LSe1-13]|uniref:Carboxymuconolactone decarboxylase family protein n=1 Tax=Gordonia sesuvii TaxID=3116777 RepID=A0ABU7MIU8_9ACTN|nr:carboxymuconolactone decarboxylase family protein [Gordonia sp. LSe1-13]